MVEEPVTVLTNCSADKNVVPFDIVIVIGNNVPSRFIKRFGASLEEAGMSQDTFKSWNEASKIYAAMSVTCRWYGMMHAGFKTLVMTPFGSWSLSNVTDPRQIRKD